MNLKHLSDEAVHQRTEAAAKAERAATTVLLHHLCEVQRRRLYAQHGYSSLFEYCVRALHMSEPQASRRINAARALADFPELEGKINSGALSVTAVSQAQSFFTKEAKAQNPLPKEERKEILESLENQSSRQAEKILLSHSSQPATVVVEKARLVSETVTEIRFAADEELMQDLNRLKEIWSHEMPNASFAELIKKMAAMCREAQDPVLKAQRALVRKEAQQQKSPSTDEMRELTEWAASAPAPELEKRSASDSRNATKPVSMPTTPAPKSKRQDTQMNQPAAKPSRYIPSTVRHYVWMRDSGCCTFVDPRTGQRCGSRHRVQLDHVVPFAKGGAHTVENLRLRCLAHNQLHAIRSYGPRVMKYMTIQQ